MPPLQTAIFDISNWQRDEKYEVYPVGSRPKELLVAPAYSSSNLITPGHHYLFKESSHNYPTQYWAEIFAYRIGLAARVPVPPAFAAHDSRTGRRGALIEWFYDMNKEFEAERFVHGVEYMKRIIPDFDVKTGSQHNLKTVLSILNGIRRYRSMPSPLLHWARTFAFDALIGNTDRHQENWGLLWPSTKTGSRVRFAPAFDNGTSLGHEQTEKALAKFRDRAHMERYVAKGRHHMKWMIDDTRPGHFDMLRRIIGAYPITRRAVRLVAQSSMADISREIAAVGHLGPDIDLSPERSYFVLELTSYRHKLLQAFG